jgi:hypothetical protein
VPTKLLPALVTVPVRLRLPVNVSAHPVVTNANKKNTLNKIDNIFFISLPFVVTLIANGQR